MSQLQTPAAKDVINNEMIPYATDAEKLQPGFSSSSYIFAWMAEEIVRLRERIAKLEAAKEGA